MANDSQRVTGREALPQYLRGHIPPLDGLRGIAILLVLIYHCTVMPANNWLDKAFVYTAHLGWSGVDLFFVLSGFLITGILLDSKGGAAFFRNFYARRVLRIFPLYYGVVVFSLVLLPMVGQMLDNPTVQQKLDNFGRIDGDEWWYWLHLSNYAIAQAQTFRHGILDISWSLSIEEQFYLVWPTVVFFLSRRNLLWTCLAIIIGAMAFRTWLMLSGGHFGHPISVYVLTPSRMDGLALGAALAALLREGVPIETMRRWAPIVGVASLAIFLTGHIIDLANGWHYMINPDGDRVANSQGRITLAFGFTPLAFFFASLLVMGLNRPESSAWVRVLDSSFLRMWGKYSYAVYLFHLPIRAVIRDLVFGPEDRGAKIKFFEVFGSQIPSQLIFFVLSAVATLIAAKLSWELYEKQFLKLKRFFPAMTKKAKPVSGFASKTEAA
ncbi:MAG: acyltransferase [Planctomycetota bacterium]